MFCCTPAAVVAGRGGPVMHAANCEKVLAEAGLCRNHKVVAHDAAGEQRWCNACGKDEDGNQLARAAGGWGTPR